MPDPFQRLLIVTPDRLCYAGWSLYTNHVWVILHDGRRSYRDVLRLFDTYYGKWGLEFGTTYRQHDKDEYRKNLLDYLTVYVESDTAQFIAHEPPEVRENWESSEEHETRKFASAPLRDLADGVKGAVFIAYPLPFQAPTAVDITASVRFRGLLVAEAYALVPTSTMGGVRLECHAGAALTRIFASYARRDQAIVELVDSVISASSFAELRWDLKFLSAGDNWSDRIRSEIIAADKFQLFWSKAASDSTEVRKEWLIALERKVERFIHPVFWEQPLVPPPAELSHLHFARIRLPAPQSKVKPLFWLSGTDPKWPWWKIW